MANEHHSKRWESENLIWTAGCSRCFERRPPWRTRCFHFKIIVLLRIPQVHRLQICGHIEITRFPVRRIGLVIGESAPCLHCSDCEPFFLVAASGPAGILPDLDEPLGLRRLSSFIVAFPSLNQTFGFTSSWQCWHASALEQPDLRLLVDVQRF